MNQLMTTDRKIGYMCALGAVLIWSGFILVSRVGGISELSAYDVIAIRYATCASLLLPFWWFKYRFPLFNVRLITVAMIGGMAYALCTFTGFQQAPASHAAILMPGLMPLFIIILSARFNHEKMPMSKWLGVAVITFGVSLLFVEQWWSGAQPVYGDLWFIAGALCWAIFSVLIKKWNITPWQVTVSLAVLTSLVYLPIYIFWLPKKMAFSLLPDIALQAVYQGVLATIIQMFFYVRAVQILGASGMGSMMAIVPIISGLGAIILLAEPAGVGVLSGLLLVAIGAYVAHSGFVFNVLNRWGARRRGEVS